MAEMLIAKDHDVIEAAPSDRSNVWPGLARRKSGGFRTIVAYRSGRRAFFVFGFAKNDRDNLGTADERDLKDFSGLLMRLSERGIETMLNGKELTEVHYEEES